GCNGLIGSPIRVKRTARPISDGGRGSTGDEPIDIEDKTVRIESAEQPVEFAWTPAETGRFLVTASSEPQPGELVTQNNRAEREVNIRDDFLRLMFVEYEPTWEWRFLKEAFHRDKLVRHRASPPFLRS